MNREDYGKAFNDVTGQMYRLTMAKNNDYGGETDAWKNFREFGLKGIVVRMSDKWSRIKTALWEERTYKVLTETILDTLMDLAVYCVIAIIWIKYEEAKETKIEEKKVWPGKFVDEQGYHQP